ncbi:MAG TPA: hypothetical protein VLL08_20055 [Kineosporiaceae bacterium]|nr:hypothetical protein [Kineosporiaceae bacterium]
MYRTTLATSLLAAALLAGNAVPAQAAGSAPSAPAASTGSTAKAADYPVADALAEVTGFVKASQTAALAEGFTSVMSITQDPANAFTLTTTVDRAGNQHMVASGDGIGGPFDSLTIAGVGSWFGLKGDMIGSIFGKAALKRALKYLGKSDATYVFMASPKTPKADADSAGFTYGTDGLTVKAIATADKTSFGDSGGVRYTLVTKPKPKEPASTITIDVLDGRIVAEGAGEDGGVLTSTWVYGAETIVAPGEAESVSIDQLIPAIEAATLPATLKAQAGRIVKKAKASARKQHRKVSTARIRHYAAAIVKKDNTDGREIRTHTSKVKNGARIYARNPYTHKTVAYKIVIVRGKVRISPA